MNAFFAPRRPGGGGGSSNAPTIASMGSSSSSNQHYGSGGSSFAQALGAPTSRHAPEEDEETPSVLIDPVLCKEWVYPVNKEVREYQVSISKNCLLHNTLVVLPTGLGKTLIAAVVMFNFYRWYPHGKVVFLAPTKPLVAQQIEACHHSVGIPQEDTAELQGSVSPAERQRLWRDRRVFFCTPQTMANDLQRGACDPTRVVCVVIDEAHKATGNFAYCTVVRDIMRATRHFRVLALSATPGADNAKINEVISNLYISNLETRTEDDPELKQYQHARLEELILCNPSEASRDVERRLIALLEPVCHNLRRAGLLYSNFDPTNSSPFSVRNMSEDWRQKGSRAPQGWSEHQIASDFAILATLVGFVETCKNYGHGSLLEKLQDFETSNSNAKKHLAKGPVFKELVALLSSGAVAHPKLAMLMDILLEHFTRHACTGKSTRAIVFSHFRDSVQEIVKSVNSVEGIQARCFIGQGGGKADKTTGAKTKGMTQQEQKRLVQDFFNGHFNVLVATCIAEEGLDIGEVDLIVNYDTHKSPIRMVQRMGRTARKRSGVVKTLLSSSEQAKLKHSLKQAKAVQNSLKTCRAFKLYDQNPRMVPRGINPTRVNKVMAIPEYHLSQVGGAKVAKLPKEKLERPSHSKHSKEPKRGARSWALTEAQEEELQQQFNYQASTGEKLYRPKAATGWKLQCRRAVSDDNNGENDDDEVTRVGYGPSLRSSALIAVSKFVAQLSPSEVAVRDSSWRKEYKSHRDDGRYQASASPELTSQEELMSRIRPACPACGVNPEDEDTSCTICGCELPAMTRPQHKTPLPKPSSSSSSSSSSIRWGASNHVRMEEATEQNDGMDGDRGNGDDCGKGSNVLEDDGRKSDHSSDVEWQADEWRDDDDGFRVANTQPHDEHDSSSSSGLHREVEVQDHSIEAPNYALTAFCQGPQDTSEAPVIESSGGSFGLTLYERRLQMLQGIFPDEATDLAASTVDPHPQPWWLNFGRPSVPVESGPATCGPPFHRIDDSMLQNSDAHGALNISSDFARSFALPDSSVSKPLLSPEVPSHPLPSPAVASQRLPSREEPSQHVNLPAMPSHPLPAPAVASQRLPSREVSSQRTSSPAMPSHPLPSPEVFSQHVPSPAMPSQRVSSPPMPSQNNHSHQLSARMESPVDAAHQSPHAPTQRTSMSIKSLTKGDALGPQDRHQCIPLETIKSPPAVLFAPDMTAARFDNETAADGIEDTLLEVESALSADETMLEGAGEADSTLLEASVEDERQSSVVPQPASQELPPVATPAPAETSTASTKRKRPGAITLVAESSSESSSDDDDDTSDNDTTTKPGSRRGRSRSTFNQKLRAANTSTNDMDNDDFGDENAGFSQPLTQMQPFSQTGVNLNIAPATPVNRPDWPEDEEDLNGDAVSTAKPSSPAEEDKSQLTSPVAPVQNETRKVEVSEPADKEARDRSALMLEDGESEAEFDTESPHKTVLVSRNTSTAVSSSLVVTSRKCEVCEEEEGDSSASQDPVLKCSTCEVSVHCSCYGVALPVQGDVWNCDACLARQSSAEIERPRCALCRVRGGAIKRALPSDKDDADGITPSSSSGSKSSKWAHVVCVLWTPELTIDSSSMRASNDFHQLDTARADLVCSVCNGRGGAVLQCAEPTCVVGAHPYCARNRGWSLLDDPLHLCAAAGDFPMLCSSHQHLCPDSPLSSLPQSLPPPAQPPSTPLEHILPRNARSSFSDGLMDTPMEKDAGAVDLVNTQNDADADCLVNTPIEKPVQRSVASLVDTPASSINSSAAGKSRWSCDACTFMNSSLLSACEMCGATNATRGGVAVGGRMKKKKKVPGKESSRSRDEVSSSSYDGHEDERALKEKRKDLARAKKAKRARSRMAVQGLVCVEADVDDDGGSMGSGDENVTDSEEEPDSQNSFLDDESQSQDTNHRQLDAIEAVHQSRNPLEHRGQRLSFLGKVMDLANAGVTNSQIEETCGGRPHDSNSEVDSQSSWYSDSPGTSPSKTPKSSKNQVAAWRSQIAKGSEARVEDYGEWASVVVARVLRSGAVMVEGVDEYGREYEMEVKPHKLHPPPNITTKPTPHKSASKRHSHGVNNAHVHHHLPPQTSNQTPSNLIACNDGVGGGSDDDDDFVSQVVSKARQPKVAATTATDQVKQPTPPSTASTVTAPFRAPPVPPAQPNLVMDDAKRALIAAKKQAALEKLQKKKEQQSEVQDHMQASQRPPPPLPSPLPSPQLLPQPRSSPVLGRPLGSRQGNGAQSDVEDAPTHVSSPIPVPTSKPSFTLTLADDDDDDSDDDASDDNSNDSDELQIIASFKAPASHSTASSSSLLLSSSSFSSAPRTTSQLHVPVSSSKLASSWVSSLRALLPNHSLSFGKLDGIADVLAGHSTAVVVRDLASILKSTSHKDLPPELSELHRIYAHVVVFVTAPFDDPMGLLAKKWKDFQHHLLTMPGVELMLCQNNEDVGSHLAALVASEKAAGRGVACQLSTDDMKLVNFVRAAPHLTYPATLALLSHFRGRQLHQLVCVTADDLATAVPWLTVQQRRNVLHYFSRAFESG